MASTYNNRADAHHESGEYESAISYYRKALRFDARNQAVYHNLCVAYAAQHSYDLAIQHYDQALQLGHDDYTHYYRFEAWLLLKEWEEAKLAATSAEVVWADTRTLLHEHYENVSDFEQKNEVRLPDDISELLGGREVRK